MKWIKCSERMPEIYQFVLVCDSPQGHGEPRCISIFRNNGNRWECPSDDPYDETLCAATFSDMEYVIDIRKLTHWMPLPKPPQD